MNSWSAGPTLLMKASRRPSGDHSGEWSRLGPPVGSIGSDSSRRRTTTRLRFCRESASAHPSWYATRSPSRLSRTWSIQRKRYRSSAPIGAPIERSNDAISRQHAFGNRPLDVRPVSSGGTGIQMTGLSRRQPAIFGFGGGALAGLVLVALMYLAGVFLGLRPLPQLLNQPVLSLMPGFVFGFLIDSLQDAGKVVEELGLIAAMIVGLGLLGSAWALAYLRWPMQYLALAFAGIGWVVLSVILLPLCGVGFLGLNDGAGTPLLLARLFCVFGVVLQLGGDPATVPVVDGGRRRLLSALPIGICAGSLGLLAWRLPPHWYRRRLSPQKEWPL